MPEKELSPREQYLFVIQRLNYQSKGYCCECNLSISSQESTRQTDKGIAHVRCWNSDRREESKKN